MFVLMLIAFLLLIFFSLFIIMAHFKDDFKKLNAPLVFLSQVVHATGFPSIVIETF